MSRKIKYRPRPKAPARAGALTNLAAVIALLAGLIVFGDEASERAASLLVSLEPEAALEVNATEVAQHVATSYIAEANEAARALAEELRVSPASLATLTAQHEVARCWEGAVAHATTPLRRRQAGDEARTEIHRAVRAALGIPDEMLAIPVQR